MEESKIEKFNVKTPQETSGKIIQGRDLLYPFAVVLMMMSFFDLSGTITGFGITVLVIFEFFQFDATSIVLVRLFLNLAAQAGAILIFFFLHKKRKIEPEEKTMPPGSGIQIVYLIYALELVFLVGIVRIIDKYLEPLGETVSTYENISPTPELLNIPLYYILFFGVLVFGAAIAEELIFRRTLIPFLERRGLGTFWVLIISALMFSLIHTPADLDQGSIRFAIVHFLGTFAGGLTLGFIYIRTRNVVYPMIMHGLSNGFAGVSLIALESSNELILILASYFALISLLVGAGVSIAALIQFLKYLSTQESPIWYQIMSDIKFRKSNLLKIFGFTVVFVLVEGGRDILFSELYELLGQDTPERAILEYFIEISYFIILICILGIIVFRMVKPLKNPDFISDPISFPSPAGRFIRRDQPISVCNNCGQQRFPNAQFCVFCGFQYTKDITLKNNKEY